MENFNIYAIRDTLSDRFGLPFFQVNDRCALREFNKMFKDEERNDYELYCIGSYIPTSENSPMKALDADVLIWNSTMTDK